MNGANADASIQSRTPMGDFRINILSLLFLFLSEGLSPCKDSLSWSRLLLKHAVNDGFIPEELEAVFPQRELQ